MTTLELGSTEVMVSQAAIQPSTQGAFNYLNGFPIVPLTLRWILRKLGHLGKTPVRDGTEKLPQTGLDLPLLYSPLPSKFLDEKLTFQKSLGFDGVTVRGYLLQLGKVGTRFRACNVI